MIEAEDVPIESRWDFNGWIVEAMDLAQLDFSIDEGTGDDPAAAGSEIDGDADVFFIWI